MTTKKQQSTARFSGLGAELTASLLSKLNDRQLACIAYLQANNIAANYWPTAFPKVLAQVDLNPLLASIGANRELLIAGLADNWGAGFNTPKHAALEQIIIIADQTAKEEG